MLHLSESLREIPTRLDGYHLELNDDGTELTYHYDTQQERTGITSLLGELSAAGINFNDLKTKQSSLEEIFVGLVNRDA